MIKHIEDSKLGAMTISTWRDPKLYQSLLTVDRAAWAWEWLRRNPLYAAMASAVRPASVRVLRRSPLIAMITLPGPEGGAPR